LGQFNADKFDKIKRGQAVQQPCQHGKSVAAEVSGFPVRDVGYAG